MLPNPYEIIFVNDGSLDQTLSVIQNLSAQDNHAFYLSFSKNFGKEAAMFAGFSNARGDYIAVMDVDLQDPPALIQKMIAVLDAGQYDCVATRRQNRKGEPPVRSWFARKFYRLTQKITDVTMVDGARNFRMMKRKVLDAIVSLPETNRFSKGIFEWVGFKTYWIAYDNIERVAGTTKWHFGSLFKYALDGIINFSQMPLVIASWIGVTMTGISLVSLIFIIIRQLLYGNPVVGWASTACIIIFIGGIQLFCMGILGQYISKIYLEVKHRPIYIVSETNMPNANKIQ